MTNLRQPIDWAAARRDLERSRRALADGFEPSPERRAEILRARAAALAARRSARGAPTTLSKPMLTLFLAGERYALALTAMAAVVPGRPLGPIPGAPASVLGTLFERADIWMIHDLRTLVGLRSATSDSPGVFLLLRNPAHRVGVRVDAVAQIRAIDTHRLTPLTTSSTGSHPLVLGATDDAVAVLDGERLIDHPALTEVM